MGPLLWTMCEGFPQPIQDQFRSPYGWSIVSGMWYTTITLCDLCRRVQWFFPTGGFPQPVVFPGRPEPWRGRHLGTAEAVPRERLEPRPGRRPLVPMGRAATYHWSVASALREGTLGSKAPRPLRSHVGCGPMLAAVPCRHALGGRALGKIPMAKLWHMIYCIPQCLCTGPCLAGMAPPRNRRVQTFDEAPISISRVAAS